MAGKWIRNASKDVLAEGNECELVKAVAHENELNKKELQELNQKFSVFLNRVRLLEAENQNLDAQLNEAKKRCGLQITRLRDEFIDEFSNNKKKLSNAEIKNYLLSMKRERAEFESTIIKDKIDFINELMANDKQILSALMQERNSIASEVELLQNNHKALRSDVDSLAADLEDNYAKLLDTKREFNIRVYEKSLLRAEIQTLNEHIAFIKGINEEEIKKFKNVSMPQFDLMQFYKTELANAIAEIRDDFETLSLAQQQEIASYYLTKMEYMQKQVEEEMNKLNDEKSLRKEEAMALQSLTDAVNNLSDERKQLEHENNSLVGIVNDLERDLNELMSQNDLRDEQREDEILQLTNQMQSVKESIQEVLEGNITLRFEINTYRHLLEREEEHLSSSIHERNPPQLSFPLSPKSTPLDSGDDLNFNNDNKRVQKYSTGIISIEKESPECDFITLKNNSAVYDQNLNGYLLIQRNNNGQSCCHYFANDFVIKSGDTVKVYCSSVCIPSTSETVVVAVNVPEWLKGPHIETRLFNSEGEEKSLLIEKYK